MATDKIAIAGFVDEEQVPLSRRGGPGRPEVAEIANKLIEAADKGNTKFAFIPVEDKIERKRIGESVRNQLRARGYTCEKVAGTGKVPGRQPGKVRTVEGLYMRASAIDIGEAPKPKIIKKKKRAV